VRGARAAVLVSALVFSGVPTAGTAISGTAPVRVEAPSSRGAAGGSGPARIGYWGMSLSLHPRAARERGLAYPPDPGELAALGASHVLLPVPWVQRDRTANTLQPHAGTPDDATLLSVMARARELSLGVVLVPQVRLQQGEAGDWRGVLRPADEARWWQSYTQLVLHHASLAERGGAAVLAIGSELTSMSVPRYAARWRRLASDARARFSGQLAFIANHDALDLQAPFEHVDIAGVSAYFPLARELDADVEVMRAAWRRAAVELRELSHATGKPVVLFEVGYPSIDGGAVRPWDYARGAVIDVDEQARAYRACVDTLLDAPFIEGAFFWTWLGPGGRFDRHYTPRGKPALAELQRLFGAKRGARAPGP
jgi:hypothetical protein